MPDPGKMLVRDHRPPQKQGGGDSGGRGATAIQWQRNFTYAEAARRADIDGNVLVVHRDEDPNSPPMRIDSDHVTAWFEPAGKAKPAADAPESQLSLKYLRAEGQRVVVTRDTQQMIARQIDYDPARHLMFARGTPQNPVNFDNGPGNHATSDAVEWDTITWNPKFTNAVFDDRPVAPGVQSGKKKSPQRSTQP